MDISSDPKILYNNITNLIGIFGSMMNFDCVFFMISKDDPNYEYYKSNDTIIPMSNRYLNVDINNEEDAYDLFESYLLTNFEFNDNYVVTTSFICGGLQKIGIKLDNKKISNLMTRFINNFNHYKIKKHRVKNIRSYTGLRPKGSSEFVKFRQKKDDKSKNIIKEQSSKSIEQELIPFTDDDTNLQKQQLIIPDIKKEEQISNEEAIIQQQLNKAVKLNIIKQNNDPKIFIKQQPKPLKKIKCPISPQLIVPKVGKITTN